jgi:rfaE bifunctional protein nucleotidyltransferase chain/domain
MGVCNANEYQEQERPINMAVFEEKIVNKVQLQEKLTQLPKPIVMTNGVFDLLHRGHVSYLAQARALGASLVVAINTDASVKRLGKGDERPINTCEDRMAVIAALESVSMVLAFDEDTALASVQLVKPDIYVKGGDYDMQAIPEGKAVLAYGGKVAAIDFEHDRSTTKTLQKLQSGSK